LNCGKALTQKRHKYRQYKYCSRACHYDDRFGKIVKEENITARNPLCLEAAKLLAAGFNRTEAANQVGISSSVLGDWLYHNENTAKTIFASRACVFCGNSIGGKPSFNRKYCSNSCRDRARYRRKNPTSPKQVRQHEQAVFEGAMEMYWSGIGGSEIARHFGIPEGTVSSWIHDFGGQKERKEPLKNRLRLSRNAAEWLAALREHTIQDSDYEESTVVLVCGKFHGHSVDKLATLIFERLKDNPLNGKVYAFCDKCGKTITTLSWNTPIFNISRYIKVSGTFIWVHEDFGKSIEISRAEFEHLISLQNHKKIVENT